MRTWSKIWYKMRKVAKIILRLVLLIHSGKFNLLENLKLLFKQVLKAEDLGEWPQILNKYILVQYLWIIMLEARIHLLSKIDHILEEKTSKEMFNLNLIINHMVTIRSRQWSITTTRSSRCSQTLIIRLIILFLIVHIRRRVVLNH